jgi:hypothetical protein
VADLTPEALAAEWADFAKRAEAGSREWKPGATGLPEYELGRATGYGECAILLSAKLAPVHAALTAERDAALKTVSRWQDEHQRLIAERDEARSALERMRAERDDAVSANERLLADNRELAAYLKTAREAPEGGHA